jgi:tetratricopeptide (TPR) repeat protein
MSLLTIQLRQRQLIEDAIRTQLDLLRRTEERRDVTSSPGEKERYNLEIKELKSSVEQSKADLHGLEDEIQFASDPSKSTPPRPESYRVSLSDSLTEEQLNSQFQKEVKELLELMEYELSDEAVSGIGSSTSPTFVMSQEGDFKTLKTLFQCLYGIIDEHAVLSFNSIYALNQQSLRLNFAIIITNTYIAPAARLLARQHQIQLLTFEDLLNTVIKLDKYLKARCRDYEQNNSLFHTYVELRYLRRGTGRFKEHKATSQEFLVSEAIDADSFEAKGDLTPYVDAWLLRNENSQICLLGEYGTGKTSFATFYFYKRALAYMQSPLRNRIPLLIKLNRYHKSADIEQLMTDFLVNECGIRRNFNTFLGLAARGKLLIILDGFDEMAKQVDVNVRRHNFKEISKLAVGRNKIILSGRPNYFLTQAEINERFRQEQEKMDPYRAAIRKATAGPGQQYEILNITLFDRWQVDEFLKRQSEYLKEKGIEDWRDLRKAIYDTYNLEELARTPVLLEIIVKTISEIRGLVTHVNAAKLYQIYTDFWLDREYDDKGEVRWLITRKDKELFVSELAWTMLKTDNLHPEIHFSQLSERVRGYFNLEKASEIEYFSSDIRFCSYLIHSASDGNYKFIHKSFMEYFSARYIYQALFVEKDISKIITDKPVTDEVFFFLSQMVSLNDVDVMRTLSRDETDGRRREFLVALTIRVLQHSVRSYEHRGSLQSAEDWTHKLLNYSEEVDLDKGRLWGLVALGKIKAQLSLYEEAEDCYGKALALAVQLEDRSSEGEVLSQSGAIHQRRGEYGEALKCYMQAIQTLETVGDSSSMGQALASVGAIHQHRGEYGEALRYYTDAIRLFEESSDRSSMGRALASVGTLHRNIGEYNTSLEYYQRALAIFRELSDRRSESQAIAQLGHMYQETGRYEEAEGFFREELNISHELGDQQGISRALSNMGYLCRMTKRYTDAEEWYRRALTTSEQLGDKQGVGDALYAIGNLYQYMRRFDDAEDSYWRSVLILKELKDMRGLGLNYYQMANVYAEQQGRFPESRKYYKKAREIFAELGDRRSISSVIHQLGNLAQHDGDFEGAERYYRESLRVKEQINDAVGMQELVEALGGLEEARQNYGEAQKLYLAALDDAEKVGNRGNACNLHARLGKLAQKVGDEQKAIQHYASYIRLAQEMNLPLLEDVVQEYELLSSSKKSNPFIVGMPLQKDTLFGGRNAELEAIHRHVQQQNHVMLIGERRMGKTSLLFHLRDRLRPPLIPIFIDLQAFPIQAEGMLGGMLRKVVNELLGRDLLSSEQWGQFSITYAHDFVDALGSILDEVKGKLKDIKLVLIIDEADMLFEAEGQMGEVLRSALTMNQDTVAVIAGTSRLLRLSANAQTSPLQNIFVPMTLSPLNKAETDFLIEELSRQVGVKYTTSALEHVYYLSGGIPFYIQLLGFELVEQAKHASKDEIGVEDVDRVIPQILSRHTINFQDIWVNLSDLEKAVVAEIVDKNVRAGLDEKCISNLQIKQLIIEENGRYRLTSGLFEEWLKSYNAGG